MLIDRLVLGCGNLTAGASRAEALALLYRARDGGITHFDTAPSYGIGTAEGIIGVAFGGERSIIIGTKVGSMRPSYPIARTVVRRILRLARGGSRKMPSYVPIQPGDANPAPVGCFDPEAMSASLAKSLRRLQRDPVDYLLLHETGVPAPATVAFLNAALSAGHTRAIGFANGGVYDPALRAACPAGWTAQASIDPQMLLEPIDLPSEPTIFHTILKTDAWLKQTNAAYRSAANATISAFASLAETNSLASLLPYYLAAANLTEAKLIYASSMIGRLDRMFDTIHKIEAAGAAEAIVAEFNRSYRSAEIGDTRPI